MFEKHYPNILQDCLIYKLLLVFLMSLTISPDPSEKWNTEVTADPGFHHLKEPSLLLQR